MLTVLTASAKKGAQNVVAGAEQQLKTNAKSKKKVRFCGLYKFKPFEIYLYSYFILMLLLHAHLLVILNQFL